MGHIDTDVPLEQLEENIHERQAELLRLQQEISEALESVNDDRQAIQEYKELKAETRTWRKYLMSSGHLKYMDMMGKKS